MTEAASTIKTAIARGKQRFFEQHPDLLKEVDGILRQSASLDGAVVNQQQEIARYRIMARTAKESHTDTVLMLLELGTDSRAEFDQLVKLQNAKMSQAFGI